MWDSNPRNLAARQFSRLQVSTTHPIFRQNLYLLNQRVGRGNRARTCDLCFPKAAHYQPVRSEEHTSELQSLMRISYAVFCLKKKKQETNTSNIKHGHNRHKKKQR